MRGSALVTMVLETIATNIASSRPLSASSTSRCVMAPGTGAAGRGGRSGPPVEGWDCVTVSLLTSGQKVANSNYIPATFRIETVDLPLRPAAAGGAR